MKATVLQFLLFNCFDHCDMHVITRLLVSS